MLRPVYLQTALCSHALLCQRSQTASRCGADSAHAPWHLHVVIVWQQEEVFRVADLVVLLGTVRVRPADGHMPGIAGYVSSAGRWCSRRNLAHCCSCSTPEPSFRRCPRCHGRHGSTNACEMTPPTRDCCPADVVCDRVASSRCSVDLVGRHKVGGRRSLQPACCGISMNRAASAVFCTRDCAFGEAVAGLAESMATKSNCCRTTFMPRLCIMTLPLCSACSSRCRLPSNVQRDLAHL